MPSLDEVVWISDHKAGLERALKMDGDRFTFADVARMLVKGEAQLWITEHACIVTEIHKAPRERAIHFWLGTGKKESVIDLTRKAVAWAKANGCSRATLAGRKGWLRVLAPDGWQESTLTYMEKEL
jgi:hypothetical protein